MTLLPVDCLVAGQVPKIGTVTTFATPRRPLKTTAIDGEIRGGEYVAHDRTSDKTALNIWLSSAKSGNAKAQRYIAHNAILNSNPALKRTTIFTSVNGPVAYRSSLIAAG